MLMELENKDAREIIDFVDRYLSYSNKIEFNSYNNGNLSINKLETNGSMYWHKAAYLYDYVDSSDFSVSNNIIHYIIEACKLIKKENKLDDLFDMLIQFLKEDVEWGFTNVAVGVIIYIIPKCLPELSYRIKKPNKDNADLKRYNYSRKEGLLKYVKPNNLYESMVMDDDGVLEILNSNSAYVINIAEVNIRLTKKVIHGLKAKTKSKTTKGVKTTITNVSKMIIDVYETDSEDVYVINITVDNSDLPEPLRINNFFAIANY